MSKRKSFTLSVLTAYEKDLQNVGKNVARIAHETMDILNTTSNDCIEIVGKRTTYARILPLYTEDKISGIIRIDGLTRNNAKVELRNTVNVSKATYQNAKKILLKPLEEPIPPLEESHILDFLKPYFVTKDDLIMVPYFGGRYTFSVASFIPNCSVVKITDKTVISIFGRSEIPTPKHYFKIEPKKKFIKDVTKFVSERIEKD